MTEWQVLLEIALACLLVAMLFYATRLERALHIVRKDRTELEMLLQSFTESTRHAENGIIQLRTAADGAGRQIVRHIDVARGLKDDLVTLVERGESIADRLDGQIRSSREPDLTRRLPAFVEPPPPESGHARVRSQAERDLLRALRVTR